jgi:hypothetical protein
MGFEWAAVFDRARGFFWRGKVLRQGEAGLQRERVRIQGMRPRAEAGGRKTPWKRNSYQDGKGLVPRMEEKGSTDGSANRASWSRKYSPHETEKAHRIGRGYASRMERGQMARMEEATAIPMEEE